MTPDSSRTRRLPLSVGHDDSRLRPGTTTPDRAGHDGRRLRTVCDVRGGSRGHVLGRGNRLGSNFVRQCPALAGPWRPRNHAPREAEHISIILGVSCVGVRVLPARVITTDEHLPIWQRVARTVSEKRARTPRPATTLEHLQVGVECDPSERDDDADSGQRRDLGVEVRQAIGDLFTASACCQEARSEPRPRCRRRAEPVRHRRSATWEGWRNRRGGAPTSRSLPSRRRHRR